MALRPGYKQTELGPIPNDWEVHPLNRLTTQIIDGTHYTPKYTATGVPFLRVTDIQLPEIDLINVKFVSADEHRFLNRRCTPEKGDLLLSKNGTIGISKVISWDWPFAIFVSLALLKPNTKILSVWFLDQFFRSDFLSDQIRKRSKQGTVTNLHLEEIREFSIPLPPTRAEQEAIAEALSDADAVIESLEQLLVKKRQIKQGAMQELLTGRKRLQDFSGGWEVKPLGDLFNFSGGFTASRDQLSSEGFCYLHYGDIHTSKKSFVNVRSEYQDIPKLDVPLKKVSSVSLLDDGDIVFVDASEDDEGTSKHVVIMNPDAVPFISGLHTIVAKAKTSALAHQYRRYCFQTAAVKVQFRFFAVGTKVSGISKSNIARITLPVPSLPEQTAIAAILSDMDAEVVGLEARLAKTRRLKQGMMQELLTGRIRLV